MCQAVLFKTQLIPESRQQRLQIQPFSPRLAAGHTLLLRLLSSCPPLPLPKVTALCCLLRLRPSLPHATCLPHGSPPAITLPGPIPPAVARLHGPNSKGSPGSAPGQPLGNQMAVAAINPFTRFPTHYHIATAAPLASSGVTTGTPCMLNPAQVSSPEVTWCWRGLTQGHSRLSSNKAMTKEAKHLKKYTVT